MATTDRLGIYGCSGHGKVLADIAKAQGVAEIIWIDDNPAVGHAMSFDAFVQEHRDVPVALGVGNNLLRQRIYARLKECKIPIATLIHPSAVVSDSAMISEGCVVMPLSAINADAVIGNGTIVNTGAVIEHDCRIGVFCHISPNVSLAGNVRVGELSHLGIGSCCIQGRSIGRLVTVAAGSCITSDIPDNVLVAGVPAVIKKRGYHD